MIKSDIVTFPMADSAKEEDPRIVFIIKDIQDDEPYVGSVSIVRSIFLEGALNNPYKMWVTLFDDQNDDEYDGAMGLQDDEDPRVLLEFTILPPVEEKKEEPPALKAAPPKKTPAAQPKKEEPKPEKVDKNQPRYMQNIRN